MSLAYLLFAFLYKDTKAMGKCRKSRASSHGYAMQAQSMEGPFLVLAAAQMWPLSPLFVSVIEGDIMSPDFIPSQPEGVFLYPF